MTRNNDDNDDSSTEFEALMQIFEGASYLYENRLSPMLDALGSDKGDAESMREPLAESHIKPSKVLIVAEVDSPGPEAKVWEHGESIIIETGDHSFEAEVPDNVDLSSIDATINNGVMRVDIPREHDVSLDVSHEQGENDPDEGDEGQNSGGGGFEGFDIPDELQKGADDIEGMDNYSDDDMFDGGDE